VVPHAGGKVSSVPTIPAFTPGTPATVTGAMNRARSDSGDVSAGPADYVIGGYDGTRMGWTWCRRIRC
jgi:hypothetical protein